MYPQSITVSGLCACGCGLSANDPVRPTLHLYHTLPTQRAATRMACRICARVYYVYRSVVASGKLKVCSLECATQERKGWQVMCRCCGVPIWRCKNAPKEPWNKGTMRRDGPIAEWPAAQIIELKSFIAQPNQFGCSLWTGYTRSGYGVFACNRKNLLVHRLMYELVNGPIPEEMDCCHSCDVNYPVGDLSYRSCCNPTHIWLGDQTANTRDAVTKRRHAFGERQGSAKLTEKAISSILVRRTHGETLQSIADDYDVTKQCIWAICKGESWRHLLS